LALTEWTRGRTGLPLLLGSLAWFECRVVGEHPAGDHVLVLGKVIDGKLLDSEAEPMTYRETGAMDGASALVSRRFRRLNGTAAPRFSKKNLRQCKMRQLSPRFLIGKPNRRRIWGQEFESLWARLSR
jgi:Flavin reductase like domain